MHRLRTLRCIAAIAVLGAALVVWGCTSSVAPPVQPTAPEQPVAPPTSQNMAPGAGNSTADQLYNILMPVHGEFVSVPNPDNAEVDKHQYLMDRFQAAKDTHPDLFDGIQYPAPADHGGWAFTFKDGSTMVWVTTSSPQGISGPLDQVVITRP